MNSEIRFTFGHLPQAKINHLEKKDTKDLLAKWAMQDGFKIQGFYFDRSFKIYLLDDFIRDFFGSMHVMQFLLRASDNQQFVPINVQAESVKFQKIRSTLTTTEIFDRITAADSKVARTTGAIIKCLPDYFQPDPDIHDHGYPIEICDQLRKMILQDYNKSDFDDCWGESGDMFSADEKDEFLFRLFSHFVIGGTLCQYEDNIRPYIDTARSIYKDLMSISKCVDTSHLSNTDISEKGKDRDRDRDRDSGSGSGKEECTTKLVVNSVVVKVNSVQNNHYTHHDLLFSRRHINNFFYIIIQPEAQTVFTLYHQIV